MPAGLWGASFKASVNEGQFIEDVIAGVAIRPKDPPKAGATHPIDRSKLAFETEAQANPFDWEEHPSFTEEGLEDAAAKTKINHTIQSKAVIERRSELLAALGADWPIDLNDRVADGFVRAPQLQKAA